MNLIILWWEQQIYIKYNSYIHMDRARYVQFFKELSPVSFHCIVGQVTDHCFFYLL